MPTELKIPTAGESITQVQIGEWFKSEGDHVERDEVLVELETDKASMELPSPVSGVLVKLLKRAGDSAAVGEVIGILDESAAKNGGGASKSGAPAASKTPAKPAPTAEPTKPPGAPAGDQRVMPAARRVLGEAGVDANEVEGTGPGGRVLKEDAERHTRERSSTPAPTAIAPTASRGPRGEEVVPMSMLRRRIAERLVEAQNNAALLTTFNEIDMSAVLTLRKQMGEAFQAKHGVKLGFMSFFVKAAIDALKLIPQVNAEIRDGNIVFKNYYDIGVAVGTDKGLVVPVVRDADRLSFAQIEQAIADLAQRARDRKLAVEELQGGTFTISNGGVYGSLLSTPIVNPPQSGILGLHAIQERPVARNGQVVIHPMMYVALSYDHRIVDGKESVTFLKRIKECVEDPTRMLLES